MKLRDLRDKNKPVESTNIKEFTREFYQTPEWKNFREESRVRTRADHEEIIFDVYEENPSKNDPEDLIEFLTDEKRYPLSEMSLEQGIIKRAQVLDHIKPVRTGGAKTKHSNVQWLTIEEHKEKTITEMKSERE